ncbi:hypothetical protein N7478_000800 [Penicillium angulare]|uniref:uncharacterized protein n=1 Tax=Penicillium angulare TaxID=116970 RepID=UPI0025404DD4|nr:uncharacterized protein N7478_000641 [Penicillium angulare]XP_056784895.1 uncharacterized protein N7478_000800 [Penicillium angulare]KAJ5291390.1 hypothetical protein N7478_000641 [Penicillium angulare]KAJ5291549.1 hypothetical protein N7478_000800 [Penicillium angulare]
MGGTPANTENAAPSLERQLLRAFSLSSSTSGESQSSASSITGDTTEDDTHPRDTNSRPGDRQAGVKRQRTSNEGDSLHRDQDDLDVPAPSDGLEMCDTRVFRCLVNLIICVRRMERQARDQSYPSHFVANEIENLTVRLAAIESAAQKMAKETDEGR